MRRRELLRKQLLSKSTKDEEKKTAEETTSCKVSNLSVEGQFNSPLLNV